MKVGQIIIDKDGKKYKITEVTNFMYSKAEATALGFHTIEEEFMPDIIVKTNAGEESLAQAIMHNGALSLEFKE